MVEKNFQVTIENEMRDIEIEFNEKCNNYTKDKSEFDKRQFKDIIRVARDIEYKKLFLKSQGYQIQGQKRGK